MKTITINAYLHDMFSKESANERLLEIMKKASAEAKSNGFKPEMLEEIVEEIISDK